MIALPPALTPTEVKRNEPLAPWTSVRVGGSAEALIRPATPDSLVGTLRFARETNTSLTLLGGGANTLVGDLGVPGFTLKLASDYFPEEVDPSTGLITLNAGSAIARIVTVMKQHALVGAEFLAGIPGTLGGATAMNAGTRHGEAMTVIDSVELATLDGLGWVTGLSYRYRHTELPAGAVVTRVRFRLRKGDVVESAAKMEADLSYRKRTQPLSQPNFGSVFTNPPGHFAGALIEQVKLKGHRVGQAQISTLHANWIVNLGGATARDVTSLMALAQERVREATGVELVPEVKRVGSFLP
ncbi:MAG: UDP-N-acetylenolpyruvoylglucosamine reductase [Myxococcaceae bacterium]